MILKTEAAYIAAKREEAKKKLGNKWLLHPDNYVKRVVPFGRKAGELPLDFHK